MIRGVHTMFYSSEPTALRAFLRDVLGFPAHDVGGGWLIFDLPEADMGVHPSEPAHPQEPGAASGTPDISFYCDDIHATMKELQRKGVEFTMPVADHGYGLVTFFKVPGGFKVQLYQPRYEKRPATRAKAKAKAKPAPARAKAKRGTGHDAKPAARPTGARSKTSVARGKGPRTRRRS